MDRFERIRGLKGLFEAAGGELQSRKKIHKLVYLLQELGDDFDQDYTYHHYGVYSPTLASDLDFATEIGVLIQENDPDSGYKYSLNNEATIIKGKSGPLSKPGNDLLLAMLGENPALLEVFSTIVYLYRNHYSGKELKDKLSELKPKLKGYFDEAYELAHAYYNIDVGNQIVA
jgi:uncharacterized protein